MPSFIEVDTIQIEFGSIFNQRNIQTFPDVNLNTNVIHLSDMTNSECLDLNTTCPYIIDCNLWILEKVLESNISAQLSSLSMTLNHTMFHISLENNNHSINGLKIEALDDIQVIH
jgi:hypothetical protein